MFPYADDIGMTGRADFLYITLPHSVGIYFFTRIIKNINAFYTLSDVKNGYLALCGLLLNIVYFDIIIS